jgi:hypothetical protein
VSQSGTIKHVGINVATSLSQDELNTLANHLDKLNGFEFLNKSEMHIR